MASSSSTSPGRDAYLAFYSAINGTGLYMKMREIVDQTPVSERAHKEFKLSILDIIHDNYGWIVYNKWCYDWHGMNGIDCLLSKLFAQAPPYRLDFFTFIESLPLAVCEKLRDIITGSGSHDYESVVLDMVKDYDSWEVYSAKCIDMETDPIDSLVHILSGKTQKGNWSFDFCMVIEE